MKPNSKTNLKLFTGEDADSFLEGLVDEFLHIALKADKSLSPADRATVEQYFDSFISFCQVTASDKIVLDNGKMTPLVNSR
jgi:hypothetical protein